MSTIQPICNGSVAGPPPNVSEEELTRIPLIGYEDGWQDIFPFPEAHRKLWACHYGWSMRNDWYRWQIEGYSGENEVFKISQKAGLRFGLLVHTYEGNPVTIDTAEARLNGGKELDVDTFRSWASRFNRIFRGNGTANPLPKSLWPFFYLEVPGLYGIMRPAYRIHPKRTSFVIIGLAPDSPYSDAQVPWSRLRQRPKPDAGSSK